MEKIATMKYHVDVVLFRKAHGLVERFPAVIFPYWIAFTISNMTICSHKDSDGIGT